MLFSFVMGCGGEELEDVTKSCSPGSGQSPSYWPLSDGNTWKYDAIYSPGKVLIKELEGPVSIPDDDQQRTAYKLVRTESDDPGDMRNTYMGWEGDLLVRYRKEWLRDGKSAGVKVYDPYFVRLDVSKMSQGDTWSATFQRTDYDENGTVAGVVSKEYNYTVESENEPLQVGDETLECVKIFRVDKSDNDVKTFWIKKGIGKVKEFGQETYAQGDEEEMLLEYCVH